MSPVRKSKNVASEEVREEVRDSRKARNVAGEALQTTLLGL